jgi:hypothetical protein
MAVKWSWAWGAETAATLETDAGWDFSSTAASNAIPRATGAGYPEFTYAGSPTRYVMNLKSNTTARSPLNTGAAVQGWLASHFYLNSASGFSNYQILNVIASSNGRSIYVMSQSVDSLKLYVDNAFKEQSAAGVAPPQTWNSIALKYDMGGTTWSGQIYVAGVAVTSVQTDSGVAQTDCYFRIGGTRNDTLVNGTYWAGIVHYDDLADAGELSRYVTRANPTADINSTFGAWSPAVNQSVELVSPLDTATTVDNAAPTPTDFLTINVNNLSTQLGISPNIYGVSVHGYASGTGSSVQAGVSSSSGVSFVDGSAVVTGSGSYCTASSGVDPNTGAVWLVGAVPYLRFKIS